MTTICCLIIFNKVTSIEPATQFLSLFSLLASAKNYKFLAPKKNSCQSDKNLKRQTFMHMQRGTFEMRTVGFKAADPAKSLSNHEKKTIN